MPKHESSQASAEQVQNGSIKTEPPPRLSNNRVRHDSGSFESPEESLGAAATIPRQNMENEKLQDLSRLFNIADEQAKTAVQDRDFARAAKSQRSVYTYASQIRKSYGNKLHDGTEISVHQILDTLAYYYLRIPNFSSAVDALESLKSELSPGEQPSEMKWKVDFDLADAYFEASDFENAKRTVLSAKDLATKMFPTFHDRLIQTYELALTVFQPIRDEVVKTDMERKLAFHKAIRSFVQAYPELKSALAEPSNTPPLIQLARSGESEGLKYMLEEIELSPPLEQADEKGVTALMYAASSKHVEVVKVLLDLANHGLDIKLSAKDNIPPSGETALHRAVSRPSPEGGVSCATNYLDESWESSAKDIVRLLLDAGIDVGATNVLGQTCAHVCVGRGTIGILRVLFEHDEEMSQVVDEHGRTLLHAAITFGEEDFVEYLIKERGTRQLLILDPI